MKWGPRDSLGHRNTRRLRAEFLTGVVLLGGSAVVPWLLMLVVWAPQLTAIQLSVIAIMFCILVLMFLLLVDLQYDSLKQRLKGVQLRDDVLVVYGEATPVSAIRAAYVGDKAVWMDVHHDATKRRRILYKADFESLQETLDALKAANVEIKLHSRKTPLPILQDDSALGRS